MTSVLDTTDTSQTAESHAACLASDTPCGTDCEVVGQRIDAAAREGDVRNAHLLDPEPIEDPAMPDLKLDALIDAAFPLDQVQPYRSRAGIGWRCDGCGSTWSGARDAHAGGAA